MNSDESTMATTFLKTFQDLNADIAGDMPARYSKRSLLDLIWDSKKSTSLDDMVDLFGTLGWQEKRAVFYIFDEHNELWRVQQGSKLSFLAKHDTFMRPFTIWTGPMSGVSEILPSIPSYVLFRNALLPSTLDQLIHNLNSICQGVRKCN